MALVDENVALTRQVRDSEARIKDLEEEVRTKRQKGTNVKKLNRELQDLREQAQQEHSEHIEQVRQVAANERIAQDKRLAELVALVEASQQEGRNAEARHAEE